jgi:predicted ATPase
VITRLHIQGYKSLRNIELCGLAKLVLLFGPNASGKSNLLDAIDLLGHLVREDSIGEAFRRHRGNRGQKPVPIGWFFHGLSESDQPREMVFEVDLELHRPIQDDLNRALEERERREDLKRPYTKVTQSRLRYRVVVEYRPAHRTLLVKEESLVALGRSRQPLGSFKPFIRHDAATNSALVKLERQSRPRTFGLPRDRTLLSEVKDYVNHPHLIAASRELSSLRVYYVEPARARAQVNDIEARDPGSHGESLASFYHWLHRKSPIRYENLQHNLARLVTGLEGVEVREDADHFLELWVRERNGGEFPVSLVSEGTLRLLCLLGIAATPEGPAVVGYEEPENGVHPARLREMLALLKNSSSREDGPQFFLTTHSPEVMNNLETELFFHCTRGNGETVVTRREDLPLLAASQLADAKSELQGDRQLLGDLVARGDI